MVEWKKIAGHFREPEEYANTSESPNGNVWLTMHRTVREIRLFAGFAGNYELPVIVISCGNDEKNFKKLEPLIQNVISCSPESAPFSKIPGGNKVNGGVIRFGEALGVLIRREEEAMQEEKANQRPQFLDADKPKKQVLYPKRPGKKSQNNGLFKHASAEEVLIDHSAATYQDMEEIPQVGSEVAADLQVNVIDPQSQREEEVEAPPIANKKKLELTKEEFENLIFGIKFRLPTRFDIPYDLRLIVWNPPYDKKELETGRPKKVGAARYIYKITFGRFFKENMLDFKTLLVGEGYPAGKKETVLLFDNNFHRGNEAEVELPRSGNGDKKKMSTDVTRVKLGSLLVDTAELKVNPRLGYTTVFTWDIATIEMKGSDKDANQNMYLVNLKPRTFEGQQDPADQEESTNEENNPS